MKHILILISLIFSTTLFAQTLTPPPVGEGFQIHMEFPLLPPQTEREWLKKYSVNLPDNVHVYKMELQMNVSSHHFILYKFNNGSDVNHSDDFRDVSLLGTNPFDNNHEFMMAWQDDAVIELPYNTAFFWDKNSVLDLNYHMLNSSSDTILPVVTLNVWTKPENSGMIQMYSELINNSFLLLPPQRTQTVTAEWIPSYPVNLWLLTSHTHKFGIDFDIYEKNPNGTKGAQLYEGFYNQTYSTNQGFYSWEHPAVKVFEPSMPLYNGFIYEAKYNNTSDDFIMFGLTTQDEMMLFVALYTRDNIVSIPPDKNMYAKIRVYPNPFNDILKVDGDFKKYTIHNLHGKEIKDEPFIRNGIYVIHVELLDGRHIVKKVIKQ